MRHNKLHRNDLLILSVLTGVGFMIWLGGLFLFWLVLRLVGIKVDFFAMTEALSTAVATAGLLSAGFVAYRELKAQDISRYIEIADKLYQELNSKENIEARRWIFQNLGSDPEVSLEALTEEGRDAIKAALNSLDRVAFLTRDGWIPEDLIMPWMNPMVVKLWDKLEGIIQFEADRRNEPDYYLAVSELAGRCIQWRLKNVPGSKITWVKDAL